MSRPALFIEGASWSLAGAPGGGDGAHQRLEMEARLRAQHVRDAMAAQSFLDHRSNGGDAHSCERFAEFRLKPGFARDVNEPLHLRRAGEGNHTDAAIN